MQLGLYNDRLSYGESTFSYFWEIYPRKIGKVNAYRKFTRLEKSEPEVIKDVIDHVKLYAQDLRAKGVEDIYILHPATYLNQRRWEDGKPVQNKRLAEAEKEWKAIFDHVRRYGRYGDKKVPVSQKALEALSLSGGYYKLCESSESGALKMKKLFLEEYLKS